MRGEPPAANYVFKHALIRDTAYDSLLRSRRVELHGRIAKVLLEMYPDILNSQPELIAHHYTMAGDAESAVDYWWTAGRRATERSASVEAINHLEKGLEVLRTLPESKERARNELKLLIALLTPIISQNGYGSVRTQEIIANARAVAEEIGEATPLFPVMYGEWAFNVVGGKVANAYHLARQFEGLARSQPELVPKLVAHRILGTTLTGMGQLSRANEQFELALAIYNPGKHTASAYLYGQDSRVSVLTFQSLALLIGGARVEAASASQMALDWAEELQHPNTQGVALCLAGALFHEICNDVAATKNIRTALESSRRIGAWVYG